VFECCDNYEWEIGFNPNPARQTLAACGYDPDCYISTAQIAPSPYTSQGLIQAKLGGLIKLIEACDDSQPPLGDFSGDVLAVYNNVIQNVITEINGYLSSIYPLPLVQTNTVAVIQVMAVSSDGLGTILNDGTGIKVLTVGNYLVAPVAVNSPAYLRHIDPLCNEYFWGNCWQSCQTGLGAVLTVTYAATPFSDENGSTVNAQAVTGLPAVTNGGTGYNIGDLLVLTGGQSFVPAKIREASLILICHSFYQRRLAPDEKNIFDTLAKMWREKLTSIGNGMDEQLDGTYKRFFSIGAVWGQKSVLFGANSL